MGAVAEIDDLEALFDQVAASSAAERQEASAPIAAPTVASVPAPVAAGDLAVAVTPGEPADMFNRVGHLTRTLHDALRQLGYDRNLEYAAANLPDARDRLNYIAELTGKAAERALTAVERGQSLQQALAADAERLGGEWQRLYAGQLSVEEFKRLAGETRDYLAATPKRADQTRAELHEIMMAQDFHDLTGQVINRVVSLAQNLETQLVTLLIESSAEAVPASDDCTGEWLTGPAINAESRNDVVSSQSQVDDLLESLGF
jgi:chemotaxis protein CheZ